MSADAFIRGLMTIDGVYGCMLSHRDGRLVGHQVDNPAPLLALMKKCGNCLETLIQEPGFKILQFVRFQSAAQEHFYVFPVQQYYLGITFRGEPDDQALRAEVSSRLDAVRASKGQ